MASAGSVLSARRVSIIGLGRLGLCQALSFEKAGWAVLGCDVYPDYVSSINERSLQSNEPGVEAALQASQSLRATRSLEEAVDFCDLILVLVATPTGIGEHAYDTGTLSRVLADIGKLGRANKHVVVCCTVLPGYIAQVGSLLLEGCAGCTLSYNPEFIAQGEIMAGLANAEVVLIGEGSKDAGDILQVRDASPGGTPGLVPRFGGQDGHGCRGSPSDRASAPSPPLRRRCMRRPPAATRESAA
eukprot:5252555-Prymnesium_polylepis.1